MADRFDAAVVGGGIMGLSTAAALARAGHRVTLYEAGPIPNPRGASCDEHRAIRTAYGPSRGYTRMARLAYAAWDRLWAELGVCHYHETGLLMVRSPDSPPWARQGAEALAAEGEAVEHLSPAALAARFPMLRARDVEEAFLAPCAGALLARPILEALAAHLPRLGVRVRPMTPVLGLDPATGRVDLAGGEVARHDRVVVAAGAWLGRLLPGAAAAAQVTPSRQCVVYFDPPEGLAAAWSRGPMLIDFQGESGFYLLPPVAGTGLKAGDHRFALQGDPETDPRQPAPADWAAIEAACARRLARFDAFRRGAARICFYACTPDEGLVLRPLGARALLLSACSGHGFKFGALMGEAAATALDDPGWGRDHAPAWAAGAGNVPPSPCAGQSIRSEAGGRKASV